MDNQWKVDGLHMEACSCDVTCPCQFLSDPTEGTCTFVVVWYVEEGSYDTVSLAGLNVAMALYAPSNMTEGNWTAALYLDDRAAAEQQDALTKIFGGQAGGHPAELAALVGEIRGVRALPITFETDGEKGQLRLGEIGRVEAEPLQGYGGAIPTLQDAPLPVAPGYPQVVAKSKHARFSDHGMTLDVSDRNAILSPFSYSGAPS